jgi:hypothetical protein
MYRAGRIYRKKVLWHQVVILSNGFESNFYYYLFTGSIYSPSISKTTTYYVRSTDFVRVPVVASVHWWVCLFRLRMPSYVKGLHIYCKWWCWFIEFSIDGIIKQQTPNYYVEKGQIVSVRTRYAVNLTENNRNGLWKGAIEDMLSALRMHLTDMLIPLKLVQKTS